MAWYLIKHRNNFTFTLDPIQMETLEEFVDG